VNDSKTTLLNIVSELKTEFPNSSIGLIGCRTTNEKYPPCEYDFIITLPDKHEVERRRILNNFVDILFIDPDTFLDNSIDFMELALVDIKIITDPRWILTSLSHSYKKDSAKYYHSQAKREIFKSIAELSRFEEAFQVDKILAAGFWLATSCYSLSSSLISYNRMTPRSSHILSEFRKVKLPSEIFEIWSEIIGLRYATGITVYRRLEALRDVVHKISKIESNSQFDPKLTYLLNEEKVNHLIKKHAVVDAFVSLGIELNRQIKILYELKCQKYNESVKYELIFENLGEKEKPFDRFSKQTIRMINVSYDIKGIKEQASILKDFLLLTAKRFSREKIQG
jgi:hypothetical protein